MEKIVKILALFYCFNIFAQGNCDTIRSTKLDYLIWNEINLYRISNQIKPFNVFEDSLMRAYTKRAAEENIKIYPTKHSDSIGYWCNSECLYTQKTTGEFKWDEKIKNIINENYIEYAKAAVEGWDMSPSHKHQLLRKDIEVATFYSIIVIDYSNKSIRFDTTFQGLSNEPSPTFDNTYNFK